MTISLPSRVLTSIGKKWATSCSFIILFFFYQTASAHSFILLGMIRDSLGMAIPGASVKIKDTKSGVSTDSLGRFSLLLKGAMVIEIAAIGYDDTAITVNTQSAITLTLRARQNNLKDVVVNSNDHNANGYDPVVYEQILQQSLSDFGEVAGYGAFSTSRGLITPPTVLGAGHGMNTGEMVPYFMPKGETKGSRYLFPGYVGGVVIDSGNGVIKNNSPIYNFDKISGSLVIRKDAGDCIEVDKAQIKGFALKSSDTTYVFMGIPSIGANQYYMLVAGGAKYAVFKSLQTTFMRSDYRANGITEYGNRYDEYVDEYAYYLVNLKDKFAAPENFAIKKKVIKQAFAADGQKVDGYFFQHRGDDINEAFVKGLVEYLK